jgi:hypothetical protein
MKRDLEEIPFMIPLPVQKEIPPLNAVHRQIEIERIAKEN